MKFLDRDTISSGRIRITLVLSLVLLLALVIIGLLGHPAADDNSKIVWKSAPYGEPRDSARH
jgi:hypothetical protein